MNTHEKHWGHHPAVPTGQQLGFGDRCADALRNGMGSWFFIFSSLGSMAGWILTAGFGIDNPQLTILNLILSCLAALQGSIILIANKRQDSINAALAVHDREILADVHRILKQLDKENP